MAPQGASNWRRPYTSIYNDNYRYGTGLYSDTLTDIEKRYSDSLSKTQLRSDRRDLTLSTFANSTLTSSPTPGAEIGGSSRETPTFSRQKSSSSAQMDDLMRSSTFESKLNSAWHSSYALDDEVQDAINSRKEQRLQRALAKSATEVPPPPLSSRPISLYDDAAFWTLPKTTNKSSSELDTTKSRKKIGGGDTTTNGPRSSQWREKSRILQDQVEKLEKNMSSCGNKLSSELTSLKSKYHNEISDLNKSVEQTSDQGSELLKLCKRQSHQLLELQSAYEDSQRNVQDALEEMNLWQNRCKSLKKEMDKLREEVEQAVHRTNRD